MFTHTLQESNSTLPKSAQKNVTLQKLSSNFHVKGRMQVAKYNKDSNMCESIYVFWVKSLKTPKVIIKVYNPTYVTSTQKCHP